ncbi:MAG: DNA polymerase I, partial [Cellulomonadaceae bacterium]|nr:DNA polymerase I [Cellulomonadaceae bacterium]
MAGSRLLLLDGHSMAFRAFYALPDSMTTTTNQPVNAVYGFIAMLTRLLETEHPTHVAVAFDAGSHTFRTDRFPQYKGTRSETPETFKGQIPLIKEVLGALNIPALEVPEYEADDILATLAAQGAAAGMEVLICSGDRDTFQLVNDSITVLYPIKGVSDLRRMTPAAVYEK